MKQELHENRHLQAVLNTVLDGLVMIDSSGAILSFNPAAERIFGYAADEVVGRNVKMLMPDPYHSEHDDYVRNYLNTGDKKVIGIGREVSARRKDGSVFPMELGINETEVDGQRMFVGTIRDITERKKLLDKLTSSNENLERFAYVASHDLQEPLRMVTSFTELLEKRYRDQLDARAKEYIDFAANGARRMQELVQDLLEYSRIGEEAERFANTDLNAILRIIKENLKESIDTTNAIIVYDNLPTVYVNPVRLTRVLQNVIGNGLKYQEKGRQPEIHVDVTRQDSEYLLTVRDNGIGFKPEYCQKIFEPFRRLHGKDEYSGTGMGLSICRKLVENMGGRMWAESEPGKGSTFSFTMPARPESEERKLNEQLI